MFHQFVYFFFCRFVVMLSIYLGVEGHNVLMCLFVCFNVCLLLSLGYICQLLFGSHKVKVNQNVYHTSFIFLKTIQILQSRYPCLIVREGRLYRCGKHATVYLIVETAMTNRYAAHRQVCYISSHQRTRENEWKSMLLILERDKRK